MLSQLTIPKKKSSEAAFDQQQLQAIGLKHAQRLASRIWTDYNVHDPGITTLELLCYALTDLSYRASFPIKDLLASSSNNAENMRKQFFTARQILPNRALTVLDYRKLLIDLEGVKNAWLQPASLTYYADTVKGKLLRKDPGLPGVIPVNVSGLYDVVIDYMDEMASTKQAVMKQVKARLQMNRNLCEDFVNFSEVGSESFLLCSEIALAPDADTSKVKAEILFQVQQYLAPSVNNYTLNEMLARKQPDGTAYTALEIFDGPTLDCGFIDDAELLAADLRTEIRLSDIISIIMDIEGVQAVKDIVINPKGTKVSLDNKWIVPVSSRKKALLDRALSRLVFYKRNMPVEAHDNKVDEFYDAEVEAARAKAETKFNYDFDIPLGNFRQPESYYSAQNHFPAVYGLSEAGVTSGAGEDRKALAYQLKGYLLFYDQILANYFAQLSHVSDLFSTDPTLQETYFHQVVDSFANYNQIYGTPDILKTLKDVDADETVLVERRNRFLDHLISRFAEQFNDFVNIMHSAFGASPQSLVMYRCEFLKDYPAISSERSLAYNYGLKEDKDLWNTENVSGLEKRLARLLGIRNFSRRNLGDIDYDIYAEIDSTPGDEFRFRIRNQHTNEIVLSSSTHYPTPELAKAEMQTAIRFALVPSGYERKVTPSGKHYFNVIDDTGEVLARRIEYFHTEEKMDEEIHGLMDYLRTHYSDEGMFLVENILLRPDVASDPLLPICPDPNCTDCAEADPYSYRLHIILPAYSSRFSNMDFRRYAEEVIRQETPAHILPKICWVNGEDMAVLEKAYRDWVYLQAGADTTKRADKLALFIETLFKVKNVYPTQELHECGGSEDVQKFILGQTSLGTMKPKGPE